MSATLLERMFDDDWMVAYAEWVTLGWDEARERFVVKGARFDRWKFSGVGETLSGAVCSAYMELRGVQEDVIPDPVLVMLEEVVRDPECRYVEFHVNYHGGKCCFVVDANFAGLNGSMLRTEGYSLAATAGLLRDLWSRWKWESSPTMPGDLSRGTIPG